MAHGILILSHNWHTNCPLQCKFYIIVQICKAFHCFSFLSKNSRHCNYMRYCAFIDLSKSHFLLSSIISTLLIFEHLKQVETSLISSYCYILQVGAIVFTWSRSLSIVEDQELVERMLDLIKVGSFCFLMFPVLGLSWYFYYEYIALGAKWNPNHV